MGDRVWKIPQDDFVAAWNDSASLADASDRIKALAGGLVPRWAIMARGLALKKSGVELKPLAAAAQLA